MTLCTNKALAIFKFTSTSLENAIAWLMMPAACGN
jgi:hypothetical protein